MNVLVTGANGQLGSEMRIVAPDTGNRFLFTDVAEMPREQAELVSRLSAGRADVSTTKLDITDSEAVRQMVNTQRIDVIINCAAYTNVEGAEDNYELAELLNASAPAILADAMKDAGGLLVHISTDYVFGKEPYNVPCKEDQKGTPTGVYGLTKLHGEEKIKASGCKSLIVRTAWLYSEFGKNFCKTMLSLTASKPQIQVVMDQAGTPTYALDLARAIIALLSAVEKDSSLFGVYHFSNEGVCSWFDFSNMVQILSNDSAMASGGQLRKCCILPCRSTDFPSKVVRPAYSVLDKSKIKSIPGVEVPYWVYSLKKCISNLA
ncbi:MAG: dTDP-4-dehydrorhamnose reductase [Bacteroidales bacterium]|nr:dTDP-4-dehydrorhamnose reductase [Candidatus Cacconaster merdequi]